jgi:hypothetical protein
VLKHKVGASKGPWDLTIQTSDLMTPLGAIRYDPKVGLVAKARSWPDQPQLVNGAVLAYESKTYTHNDQTLPKKAAQANLIPEIQGEHKCCAFEQVQEAVGS